MPSDPRYVTMIPHVLHTFYTTDDQGRINKTKIKFLIPRICTTTPPSPNNHIKIVIRS